MGAEGYFITFVDVASRYAYVTPLNVGSKTPALLKRFLDNVKKAFGAFPACFISENTEEYMSKVVEDMLVNMDVTHVPIVPQNQEENGIAERYNGKIMNAVREALKTAKMSWTHLPWALAEANSKYNQLPHRSTGKTPQEIWFGEDKPNIDILHIFGQLGYIPVMRQAIKKQQHGKRGLLARYLRRDGTHMSSWN